LVVSIAVEESDFDAFVEEGAEFAETVADDEITRAVEACWS
jgi:hypothetical protein